MAEKFVFGSLLLLVLLIPFNEGGNGYIVQLVTQMILLCCAVVWAIQTLRTQQIEIRLYWIDGCILGFLVWCLVSSAFSAYAYASLLELIKIFSYTALFYLCRILIPLGTQRSSVILFTILGSSVLQGVFAWFRYFAQHARSLQGGFLDPNNLACFLVIGINIGLSYLLFSERQTSQKQRTFVLFGLLGIFIASLIVTVLAIQSRGAVLSLIATGVLLCALKSKKLAVRVVVLFCLLSIMPIPGGSVFQRLQKRNDPFAYQRLDIWRSSLNMAADHPFLGVGLGMFPYYGHQYNFPVEQRIARYGKHLNAAHNDLLQITTELGIPACLFFMGAIGLLGYGCIRRFRFGVRASCPPHHSGQDADNVGARTSCPPHSGQDARAPMWQVIAASAGILGILIQAQVSNVLHPPAIAMIGAILVSLFLDDAPAIFRLPVTFNPPWYWYGGLGLAVLYILVPVMLYPFLAHVQYLTYFEQRRAKNPDAIEHVHSAIRLVSIHAGYHHTIGLWHLEKFRENPNLDDFYQSYKFLTQAIRLNPVDADAYESLAELHREMFYKKLRSASSVQKPSAYNALREYQNALQYKPYNPFWRVAMAGLHADIDEFEQAIALLQEAVEIEPNFVGGYQMLGNMLNHLQRHEEARAASQRAIDIITQYGVQSNGSPYVQALLRPIL